MERKLHIGIRVDRKHRSDHRLTGNWDVREMIFTRVRKEKVLLSHVLTCKWKEVCTGVLTPSPSIRIFSPLCVGNNFYCVIAL